METQREVFLKFLLKKYESGRKPTKKDWVKFESILNEKELENYKREILKNYNTSKKEKVDFLAEKMIKEKIGKGYKNE